MTAHMRFMSIIMCLMIPQLDPRSDSFFKGGGKSDDRWVSVCMSLCVWERKRERECLRLYAYVYV